MEVREMLKRMAQAVHGNHLDDHDLVEAMLDIQDALRELVTIQVDKNFSDENEWYYEIAQNVLAITELEL